MDLLSATRLPSRCRFLIVSENNIRLKSTATKFQIKSSDCKRKEMIKYENDLLFDLLWIKCSPSRLDTVCCFVN